jgi:DNA-binding LacI/PurR family transcriptional regulator
MLIVLLLTLALLTGCQAATVEPTEKTGETAYPLDEGYPLEEVVIDTGETAYPIQEADLQNLYGTWALVTYLVSGGEEAPPAVTFTFREDGTYSRETEKGLIEGTWRAEITYSPHLILTSDTQEVQAYRLLTLNESELRWQITQNDALIEEAYSPAN